jgi:hypothetical protein
MFPLTQTCETERDRLVIKIIEIYGFKRVYQTLLSTFILMVNCEIKGTVA